MIAGFVLGRSVPGIDQYLLPVIGLIVAVSLAPLAVELIRARRGRPNEPATADKGGKPAAAQPIEPMPGRVQTRMPRRSRVILVDNDIDRRTRLGAILENAADVDLLGTASDAATTSALLLVLGPSGPDTALVALDPPSGDSVVTTARIRAHYPHLRVWTYGQARAHPLAKRAMRAGANGVLAESRLLEDLRQALQS